ncbi:hypothetical protein ACFQ3W_11290 [Paenibacillus puldeungensis]|uniref:Uncharacterized protein n=1 Tax=Paenibacillus puldeungensis TaxID=696536 RepID=A0ABW3RXL8_9BACL
MFKYNRKTYIKPVLVCKRCGTKVFELPENLTGSERVVDTIYRSKAIPPQPKAEPEGLTKCATCGLEWWLSNALNGLRVEEDS